MSQRSHIEVGGWAARHYDLTMDLLLWQFRDPSIPAGLRAAVGGGEVGGRG